MCVLFNATKHSRKLWRDTFTITSCMPKECCENFRTSHFTFHVNTGTHAHFSWLLWCHRRTIFGSTKNIQSKVLYRTISSLSFYNLKNLFSPQRTFCETERFLRLTFGQKGYSMASWSTFIFKSVLDKHNNCASTEISVRQGNLIYYKLKDNKTKARPSLQKNKLFLI